MVSNFSYLIADLLAIAVWVFLFIWRKDIRKEMLIISFIFGIAGPLAQLAHVNDWWTPLRITNSIVGLEDFLFGFSFGGICSVIYSIVFDKKIRIKREKKLINFKRNINIIILLILGFGIFFGGHYLFNLNTFISSIIALTTPTIIIYIKRMDLIKDSLISGLLTVGIMFVLYQIIEFIMPGFFEAFWLFENIGKILVLKIPLEEYIWFFLAGAFIGPLYEYWQEAKLINIKN